MDFVLITHPDIEDQAVIPLDALALYAARGWILLDRVEAAAPPAPRAALTRPAGNASLDTWRTYAVALGVIGAPDGLSYDEATAMTRDQLAAHFADAPPTTDPTAPAADTQGA